ncbi:vitamin K epoxide reductase family protein [Candidatus Woesearchaeota archaeon]|nr:vitamin K epoxide reductase family protein [Candidatus Woesearchaeota archaeon]HIH38588.1 vitamin K epoxide reductase family protein [Candidatus Woesearchaeota archaeon]HIH48545.1 vitamin K epoxide reductase family protein [Candidatus Woesearchaeota archaeon]HIJ02792.1 vitamin K epoxide reductase family protein [Candidatus Woesearchaeota archaeon]
MEMILILGILGLLLSLYALYIEKRAEKQKGYKAACDFNNKMSCTKAFTSKYGKTFGLPNSVYGMAFYLLIIILSFFNQVRIIQVLAFLAVLGSCCLAYMLYVKLRDVCIVCTAIYIVNILLLILSFRM